MYKEFLRTGEGDLYIPCDIQFQLTEHKNSEEFIDEVLLAIAQTLLRREKELRGSGCELKNNSAMDKWINSPLISRYNASLSVLGCGGSLGQTMSTNNTAGFSRSGFRVQILDWLKEVFPYNQNGGMICILDNIELLQTCDKARKQIEELRDTLLYYTGIKWVLCGALGIVSGIVSSKRLEGRLHSPIEIGGINQEYISDVLSSRIKVFAYDMDNYYLPIRNEDFKHLYKILNNNLRNTLSYANNYCLSIADEGQLPKNDKEKQNKYREWINKESVRVLKSVKILGSNKLETLKKCIEFGGELSLSDYADLGFNTLGTLRNHINELVKYSLMSSTTDDGDKRKKQFKCLLKAILYNMRYHNSYNKVVK